jgi:hypothetical protein
LADHGSDRHDSYVTDSGGPSGIIVDNGAATGGSQSPQASSLYFSTQANGTCNGTANQGCAVKVTQAGFN